MKLIHLSDLHLGKRVHDMPMLDDQRYILAEIINIIDSEKPTGVIIAGDVYDKTVPSAEAVELFDDFLVRLHRRGLYVFVISGNHDSPERIAFGGRIMREGKVFLSPVYTGDVQEVVLSDEYGEVGIYMLPFVKPAQVKRLLNNESIQSFSDAVEACVKSMQIDKSRRNVLVTHQFVTGAKRSDSEDISVGGADNVSAEIFAPFDYVALGHIHGPQNINGRIRYCGTPLKYSFSEAAHEKSVTVLELKEKGDISVRCVPLKPKHDMVEIRGKYADITLKKFYENTTYTTDYMHVTLTDELDIPDALGKLRTVYKNLLKLDYDNTRTRSASEISTAAADVPPIKLFADFYRQQNNVPMTDKQSEYVSSLLDKLTEDGV